MKATSRITSLLIAVCLLFTLATPAQASAGQPALPAYLAVSGLFDFPILRQASTNYVSWQPNTVTLFDKPLSANVIGLLAHNGLAGRDFYRLAVGDLLDLRYLDGSQAFYRIAEIRQFQALGQGYPYFEFIDLQTGERLSDREVYDHIYLGHPGAVVLQTCLARNGRDDWGLTFWIAYSILAPVPALYLPVVVR